MEPAFLNPGPPKGSRGFAPGGNREPKRSLRPILFELNLDLGAMKRLADLQSLLET